MDQKTAASPRIGIYRTRYLGDLILFVPVLRKLLALTDPQNLFLVVNEGTEFPLKQLGVPYFSFDRGTLLRKMQSLQSLKKRLKNQFFDYWVDMTLSDRSRHVTRSVQARMRVACGSAADHRSADPCDLFVPVDYNHGPGHVVDLWEQVFRKAGIPLPESDKDGTLPVDPEALQSVERFLEASNLSGRPLLALHPGGRHWFKRWPPDRFGQLATRWHQENKGATILVATPAERTLIDSVRSAVLPEVPVVPFGGTVPELHALFSRVDVFVGNDSGPLHLARSAGTRVLGLYGSTLPAVWGPLRDPSDALRGKTLYHSLSCSPCDHTGCSLGKQNCLRQISLEESFRLLTKIQQTGRSGSEERT
ncbi:MULTISPECIES: glycosyltransferase family 9 protein [Leptospirillum]|jgi:heptosyltransferase-3|uniref:Heptosyltransferase n=1 Tax=Leptospirillum ferriphilum YSK TaxID=1441628 RepID=A0A059Y2B7_9BACT|nr:MULTISPECIES: glycosyltransferase family 9 protein [Leptospirillum]EAY56238.1 MAG: putative heptosyltransferase family protein [Leptospirillum rubarum]EIJ75510.1 MAG: Putative heptosyltransferase family protein [Leptospirillum sp. Group II 'C75']AIA31701.1 hypothetical protein Y981_06020 [Leptospirillum ferriphilum YSK]AKS23584.1 hypothetical protein ABH19_07260 [Leptospirillum sp. Group II 'CF-1']OOH84214.1 hypothetical protein BOX30_00060 [Leptospirillum ferriphilum]